MRAIVFPFVVLAVAGGLYWLLAAPPPADVVLYCGVDQDQSRPIATAFAEATGLRLDYQGEMESARSVGLPARLDAERENPRADVYWGNEIMQMVSLCERGLIDDLPPGVAERFPEGLRDPNGRYVAFGARARILMVNTDLLKDPADYPTSIHDLLDPEGRYASMGYRTCMAKPLTGTTYTHAVALLVRDAEKGKAFLEAVAAAHREGSLRLTPSNGSAMQLTRDPAEGIAFCLTDTDDYWVAKREGWPVTAVYPDQAEDEMGTVLIPNTVALVKGRPSLAKVQELRAERRAAVEAAERALAEAETADVRERLQTRLAEAQDALEEAHGPESDPAVRLLRWLVSAEVEARLANGPSAQIPMATDLADLPLPDHVRRPGVDFRAAEVDWQAVGEGLDRWRDALADLFRAP